MQKQSLLLSALLLCMFCTASAQDQQNRNKQPASEFIYLDESESTVEKQALFQKHYQLTNFDELRLLRVEQDELGFTHEKFLQVYKGVIVDRATVTVHSRGGRTTLLTGNYTGIADLDVVPTITAEAAFLAAEAHVGAKHYRWEEPVSEHNDYEKPKGELVVAVDFLGGGPARLAYKFDIYATDPLYRAYVFIDAHTGQYIQEQMRIHHANVPATGTSLYNGVVSFTAEDVGPYRLRQTSSGGGVQTFNLNNGSNYGAATDFTSATTNFSGDATGVEAHWCSEQTYAYFFGEHGRNSYNNAGAVLKSYVHFGNNYANAFWDGSRMTYGDGGGGITPLVTLDICGHEIGHAVTEFSANLVYANQPGALNESFSDIFGECVENFAVGGTNWLLGSEIGIVIRSMSDPNAYDQPDTYLGDMWYTGGDQDFLVHTNSGVQNKWFYVLSVGENGTNDNGDDYCVAAIGIDAAAAIAYRNLTVYLSAGSNYAAARTGAIQAARDLYGIDSPEEVATTNAWRAVGVGAGFGPKIKCPTNIVVSNASNQCSATVNYATPSGLANCPTTTQTVGNASGSIFPVGTTTNTFRVVDATGASSTCAFTVQVNDTQNPTITCPANVTLPAGANCQATLANYSGSASASDNCAPPTLSQLPLAGATIGVGTTTVTLRASDGAGLSATCTMTVTIVDQTPPSVVCKSVNVPLNAAGTASITTANVFQSATDNCGTVNQVSVTPNTFNCNNLGLNTVTLLVNDGNGNNATCMTQAKVFDNLSPTVLCKNVTVNLDGAGNATVTPAQVNNGSFDNCTLANLSLNQTSFSCANIGTNTVTLTGSDQSANNGTCQATITVNDLIAPLAICKNIMVQLNGAGTATVPAASVNNGSSDNCSLVAMLLTPNTFTCANVGTSLVTLTVTDPGGNTATCTATVTVQDNVAPLAKCKNINVFLDDNGHASITPSSVNNNSSDACGIQSMSINTSEFDCGQLPGSPVPVWLTVKDIYNNQSSCQALVTVKDNLSPTAVCQNVTVQLNAQGKVTVQTAALAGNSFDNCGVWSYSPVSKLYTTANLGVNNLTITVKDWSGNPATCVSQVTVLPYGGNQPGPGTADRQSITDTEDTALQVFPNPTTGQVMAQFQLSADQSVILRLFDVNGRQVLDQKLNGQSGNNNLSLDLDALPMGWYLLEMQADGVNRQKRLLIQRS